MQVTEHEGSGRDKAWLGDEIVSGMVRIPSINKLAVYFTSYDLLKSLKAPIKRDGSRDKLPMWYIMSCGAMAGNLNWLISYPMDLVKTEMQTDNLKKPKYSSYK